MELELDGTICRFQPIQRFRACFGLSDDFGVATFTPKDVTGLGSIQGAGAHLQQVQAVLLVSVPSGVPPQGWMAWTLELQMLFRRLLVEINPVVGLHPDEIDYAVAGLGDVCQTYLYERMTPNSTGKSDFERVYRRWLSRTVERSHLFSYAHNEDRWYVQILRHAYGRFGMIVITSQGTYYLLDTALGCPAEGFMYGLLREIAGRIDAAFEAARTVSP